MRLWSVGSYKCLDEFSLPDRAPLVDFDFDESKVMFSYPMVVTSIYAVYTHVHLFYCNFFPHLIQQRMDGCKDDQIYAHMNCAEWPNAHIRYLDPNAVVGCEDGRARVFDMYLKKWSQIIKIHDGPVTCLSLTEDQMIIGGSSVGSITVSCSSANERVATLRSYGSAGISTLCFNPSSHLLFAGSFAGHASCWDLRVSSVNFLTQNKPTPIVPGGIPCPDALGNSRRTRKPVWETRVSPNVIHSIHHLRNDTRTLVMGGIDGVLRVADQQTGEVVSRYIIEGRSSSSSVPGGSRRLVERKKAERIAEDTRLDLMPRTSRPSINCVAVGMQKVVTTHPDNYVRVWKFDK
ncbi:hypothetical protein RJ640_027653 [Escallonia rubra]|uniref:Uncharacterized protein n=1 Tax=Escallonia rubra TaxID=112253 RepID=A0AA88U224_9ASTE|nr:hypothetical protein RJ640_027653 [Escallonia rubra]